MIAIIIVVVVVNFALIAFNDNGDDDCSNK